MYKIFNIFVYQSNQKWIKLQNWFFQNIQTSTTHWFFSKNCAFEQEWNVPPQITCFQSMRKNSDKVPDLVWNAFRTLFNGKFWGKTFKPFWNTASVNLFSSFRYQTSPVSFLYELSYIASSRWCREVFSSRRRNNISSSVTFAINSTNA